MISMGAVLLAVTGRTFQVFHPSSSRPPHHTSPNTHLCLVDLNHCFPESVDPFGEISGTPVLVTKTRYANPSEHCGVPVHADFSALHDLIAEYAMLHATPSAALPPTRWTPWIFPMAGSQPAECP